ncbi:MAG: YjgN family protein [Halarcobacter sp.]
MIKFQFTGSAIEYFKIWIVNTLLTIVTFGIYYPWAKVRNNRYLYANSILDGKNFEYHATGKQLFIGYLIAASMFILYNILNSLFPILNIFFVLLFFIVLPWLMLKAMKFNLFVTSFNNIRFDFEGELKESYLVFLLLPFIGFIICTLPFILLGFFRGSGIWFIIAFLFTIALYILVFSYFNVVKNRFFIDFTKYGKTNFDTTLDTPEFIKIVFKTVSLGLFSFLLSCIIVSALYYIFGDMEKFNFIISLFKSDPKNAMLMMFQLLSAFLVVFYIFFIFTSIIVYAYYNVKKREYLFANTTFDKKISFESTMKFLPYAYILITNFLLTIVTLGFAYPLAKVRVTRYTLENSIINIKKDDFSNYYSSNLSSQSAIADQVSDVFDVGIGIPF